MRKRAALCKLEPANVYSGGHSDSEGILTVPFNLDGSLLQHTIPLPYLSAQAVVERIIRGG
jgi:hypothetical protein